MTDGCSDGAEKQVYAGVRPIGKKKQGGKTAAEQNRGVAIKGGE